MSQAQSHPAFEIEEIEPQTAQKIMRENNNLIGDLNPRYFERVMGIKQAKQQNLAKYGSIQNISYF